MKRGRKSVRFEDGQNQKLGPSINDLPRAITVEILARLPVKRIIVCKSVCKNWLNLISDPEFAKLHFGRAEAYPLIRSVALTSIPRTLYLVEPPECSSSGFDLGCWRCSAAFALCNRHLKMKLETKLKIPLLNADLIDSESEEDETLNSPNSKGGVKRKRCIRLNPKDHRLDIVNSCNGFLCLSEPSKNDPVIVCNPITGEYINLPVPTPIRKGRRLPFDKNLVVCALGFSTETNQYKVIRMFNHQNSYKVPEAITGNWITSHRMTEIHTLGTGSWKMIGHAPYELGFPTYLNGSLHWVDLDCRRSHVIISFNFDNERFQLILPPPYLCTGHLVKKRSMSLGVLRHYLCICDASCFGNVKVWVMKEYGAQGSWQKEFVMSTFTDKGHWLYGLYAPLSYLSNGAILLFHDWSEGLIYYDPKQMKFKLLKAHGIKSKYEAIAHIPSFISLKDVVMGSNPAMVNNKPRCKDLRLWGENKSLFLVEDDADRYV